MNTQFPTLQGLTLTNFELSTAERKLSGQTVEGRCQVMASMLQVPGVELCKYVKYWLAKLPADNGNRWSYREDLEQSIYRKLVSRKDALAGQWPLVCQCIKGEYATWYTTFTRQRNMGDFQAISLERAHQDENGDPEAMDLECPIDQMDNVNASIDATRVLDALPVEVRNVLKKRLAGVPLTQAERARWSRFVDNSWNVVTILGLINGTLKDKPVWSKRGRPAKAVTLEDFGIESKTVTVA